MLGRFLRAIRLHRPSEPNEREERNSLGVKLSGTPERTALCRFKSSSKSSMRRQSSCGRERVAILSAPGRATQKTRTALPDNRRAQFKSFHSIAHTVAAVRKRMGVPIPPRRNSATTSQPSLLGSMISTMRRSNFVVRAKLQTGFAVPRKIDSEAGFAQTFG